MSMMTNTGSRRTPALVAAALACLLIVVLVGCAAGSAAPHSSVPAHSSVSALSDHTHFIDYSVNSDGPGSAVIVTGAIGDYGHGISVYPDGQVDRDHTGELELRLTHGTFRLQAATLFRAILRAFGHWRASPRTCSGSITASAPAPVVAGSGTGSYRGITGTFAASATIDEVDRRGPGCQNATGAFLAQVIVITGTGSVTLQR